MRFPACTGPDGGPVRLATRTAGGWTWPRFGAAAPLLPSVRGELLTRLRRTDEAKSELARAARLAGHARERAVLERKLRQLR